MARFKCAKSYAFAGILIDLQDYDNIPKETTKNEKWIVRPDHMDNNEVSRLNRQLGLAAINKMGNTNGLNRNKKKTTNGKKRNECSGNK